MPKEKKTSENLFKRHDNDTGSPEFQISTLSSDIEMLQEHLKAHSKDFDAKRSILKKVARRRTFLKFLKNTDVEKYQAVAKKLGLKV